MHPQELTDGIEHVMIESQSQSPVCPFKKDNSGCGHVDSGDAIRAKQQPTEELQRTEEYTKADNRLRPDLRPLLLSTFVIGPIEVGHAIAKIVAHSQKQS